MAPRLGLFIGLFWWTMTGPLVWREGLPSPPADAGPGAVESSVSEDTWLVVLSVGSPELEISGRERAAGGTTGTGSAEADG